MPWSATPNTQKKQQAAEHGLFLRVDAHCFLSFCVRRFLAQLNQTNIGNNNNKFYVIQLLQSDSGSQYFVWNRWGRVGATGQNSLAQCGSLDAAKAAFKSKFSDKTKNNWDNRKNFTSYSGKYVSSNAHAKQQQQTRTRDAVLPRCVLTPVCVVLLVYSFTRFLSFLLVRPGWSVTTRPTRTMPLLRTRPPLRPTLPARRSPSSTRACRTSSSSSPISMYAQSTQHTHASLLRDESTCMSVRASAVGRIDLRMLTLAILCLFVSLFVFFAWAQMMKQQMIEVGYDANKLPLGKLSKGNEHTGTTDKASKVDSWPHAFHSSADPLVACCLFLVCLFLFSQSM